MHAFIGCAGKDDVGLFCKGSAAAVFLPGSLKPVRCNHACGSGIRNWQRKAEGAIPLVVWLGNAVVQRNFPGRQSGQAKHGRQGAAISADRQSAAVCATRPDAMATGRMKTMAL